MIQLYFKSVDLDPSEARSLFKLMDADQSGTVEAEEFVMGCLRLRGTAKAIDLATLMYENRRWFHRFEKLLKKLRQQEKQIHAALRYTEMPAAGRYTEFPQHRLTHAASTEPAMFQKD